MQPLRVYTQSAVLTLKLTNPFLPWVFLNLCPTFSTLASAVPVGLGTVVAGEVAAVAAVLVEVVVTVVVDVTVVVAAVATMEAESVGVVGVVADVVMVCPDRTTVSFNICVMSKR